MVDEAHGTGAIGPDGRGAVAEAGLEDEVDVIVGTLGKALGSYGAYVCCDQQMAKYLINTARTLIFSTALPPPAVAAAMAALELLREQPRRVEKLQRNAAVLREALADQGLPVPETATRRSCRVIVGDAAEAVRASERALEKGVFAQAIRPPTVPAGSSRLRLAVMASHTKSELREAAQVLACVRAGVGPRAVPDAAGLRRPRATPPTLRGVFVTGTDTGVGKSVVAAAICAALAARGERVAAFKPVGDRPRRGARRVRPHDHELLAAAASAGSPRRTWRRSASGRRCRRTTPPSSPAS